MTAVNDAYRRYFERTHADLWAIPGFVGALGFDSTAFAALTALVGRDSNGWIALVGALLLLLLSFLLAATTLALFKARAEWATILRGRSNWLTVAGLALGGGALCYAATLLLRFVETHGSFERAPYTSPDGGWAWVVLGAPFIEELLFQVVLQTRLQRFGGIVSVLGTTAVFLFLHRDSFFVAPTQTELMQLAPVGVALLIFALIRHFNGSFVAYYGAHALSNSFAIWLG